MTDHNVIKISLVCLLLSACSNADMREKLGLNRHGPDEFQVVSRPPLSVPPEFNLRPPHEGGPDISGNGSTADQAHNTVLGVTGTTGKPLAATAVQPVASGSLPDSADSSFLSHAGADKASSSIRQNINNDIANGVTPKDSGYAFGLGSSEDPVVDSAKEAERLKNAKAQDKPPTEGTTPVVQEKSGGWFGNIF